MSRHEYLVSRDIVLAELPFYSLIMAAMRQADTNNLTLLQEGFPMVWIELEGRYESPDGRLPGEAPIGEERT